MHDLPTNMGTIRPRQEQDRLRLAARDAYVIYLISRSRGVLSAVEPALACWRSAEERYLLTCHASKGAAPGDAENLGSAPEAGVPVAVLDVKEDPRLDQLVDQVALMRGDVVRNTVKLEAILAAMKLAIRVEEYVMRGTGSGEVPRGLLTSEDESPAVQHQGSVPEVGENPGGSLEGGPGD